MAENLRGRIRNIVKANGGSIPDWEDVLHYVEGDRFMRVPGMSDRELRDLAKGSRATWQQMRASGLNPMWVHHVGEDALGSMRFPTLRPEREMRLSQTRKRTMDMVATDRLLVAGMHMHFPGFLNLNHRAGGGYELVPEIWDQAF